MINKNLHPLQSLEWGKFREKTGIKVVRINNLQLTIHPIPHTNFNIGYLPKSSMPTKEIISKLHELGKKEHCVFIQLEPNVEQTEDGKKKIESFGLIPSAHPLFTKYTFILDLTKSEEELLKDMNSKTRYNIKVAQKHGVVVKEDNSPKAFERYLSLTKETTNRKGFYSHTEKYHQLMWDTIGIHNSEFKIQNLDKNRLTAHLLTAIYNKKILVTWIVFILGDTLYYPYGASSSNHKEVMASNLMMWEAIRFGKKLGLKKFDMWGSLGPNPDSKDPWFGFHRFKEGYGAKLTEFLGSYDLIIDKNMYRFYKIADKFRYFLLKLK